MKTIVLADRHGHELAPLNAKIATTLLPVGGKPMLVHALEGVVLAGIDDAHVALGPFSHQVRALVGAGERWGLRLDVQLTRGERSVDACVQHSVAAGADLTRTETDTLVVRGDVMRTADQTREFTELARSCAGEVVVGMVDGRSAGIWYLRAGVRLLPIDAWNAEAPGRGQTTLELPSGSCFLMDSLQQFHRVNVDLARGRIPGIAPAGRERQPGFFAAPRAQIPRAVVHEPGIIAGPNCDVHREASLGAGTVLSENIYVDRQASVRDSVVLPNTYLGEMTALEGNIAWQNQLIDAQTGTVTEIADAFLMGTLEPPTIGSFFGHWANRFAALAVFALTLPLWPLAWALAHLRNHREPYRRRNYLGNLLARDERGRIGPERVETWEFNSNNRLLRHLPKLIPAMRGEIRLVGVSTLTPDEFTQRTEDWELLRDEAPVGLLGPAQLVLPPNAPLQERLMADAVYVRLRTTRSDFAVLCLAVIAVFSRKAWTQLFASRVLSATVETNHAGRA